MDILDRVAELTPRDAADRVDQNRARNALHREVNRARRAPRRFGRAIGAGGGVAAVTAAVITGVVIGGAGTAITAVAPPSMVPEVAPASAAELVRKAADVAATSLDVQAQGQTIGDGQWLKVEAVHSYWEFLSPGQPSWTGGFSPVRERAVAAVRSEATETNFYANDIARNVYGGTLDDLPRETVGDIPALTAAWNAIADKLGGTLEDQLAADFEYSYYGDDWLEWFDSGDPFNDPDADWAALGYASKAEFDEAVQAATEFHEGISPVDQVGAYPTDPAEFLTAWARESAVGDAAWIITAPEDEVAKRRAAAAAMTDEELAPLKQDAIGQMLVRTQQQDFAAAPGEYRATVLRAIALDPTISIDGQTGDVADIRFTTTEAEFVAAIDVTHGQVLSVDQYTLHQLVDTAGGEDVVATIGSTDLLPEGTPDRTYRLEITVVDEAPTDLRQIPADDGEEG